MSCIYAYVNLERSICRIEECFIRARRVYFVSVRVDDSNIRIYVRYRFEKLDITPKSAQKIKPVLERWMKEAEER